MVLASNNASKKAERARVDQEKPETIREGAQQNEQWDQRKDGTGDDQLICKRTSSRIKEPSEDELKGGKLSERGKYEA